MRHRIEALRTMVRLRERDVTRCERAMEEARAHARLAESHAGQAAEALDRAMAAQEQALGDQRRAPANPHVQLHCRTCAAQCEARRDQREQADLGLTEARTELEERARAWRRAQVRHDALVHELGHATREVRRQIGRRADEEAQDMVRAATLA